MSFVDKVWLGFVILLGITAMPAFIGHLVNRSDDALECWKDGWVAIFVALALAGFSAVFVGVCYVVGAIAVAAAGAFGGA